ncbi:unnamed protein product [Phytomonas sp. Hart1]|nr:unnamed protein product [Phytomonas sp. Hart1]|eukprot:CCW68522.1 unnamed protein product [Phytomonas sp. isolate Hart1]
MKRSVALYVAPWVPPPRQDVKITMPPPPGGEVGGSFGVSLGYSDRLARMPYWQRMALSTYELRMRENETRYPMSPYREGEYDLRYTRIPYLDHHKHRPLLEVGEARQIPSLRIPVIFLVHLWDEEKQTWFGRRLETVYVGSTFAREELIPQRYAIYATPEAYQLLGLPVIRHHIHDEIPKTPHEYKKLMEKQSYEEERWKYTIEYLFRRYEDGPPALLDRPEDGSDGVVEGDAESTSGAVKDSEGTHKGPLKQRKARKIKLF